MTRLHLISNAHIDPVWQWQWPEGAGAAITTFSAAADFCENFDDFIFCHNEAILYQWVEEYAPELFERIRRLVKKKKWHIMGGWFLQPDCNMPSGESICRQILRGIEYFKSRFGDEFERPRTVTNFDVPGHSEGLVQLFKDAGYDSFIYTRGGKDLGCREFIWRGLEGSEILGYRTPEGYNTLLGKIEQKITPVLYEIRGCSEGIFLWGVGNHGGGPTRQDYRTLQGLKKKFPDVTFIQSTPEKFFQELEKKRSSLLPVTDLGEVHAGTYSAQVLIKQTHMELENMLYTTERMAAHASENGMKYPGEELKRAEYDLLCSEFHDTLPGSSIRSVETDALQQMHHGLEELYRIRTRAFFFLTGGQSKAAEGEYPIFVYNPHPFSISEIVECEFMLADQNWSDTEVYIPYLHDGDREVPLQIEKEASNVPLDWRKRFAFRFEAGPFEVKRYSCFTKLSAKESPKQRKAVDGKFRFDNGTCRVVISEKSGLLESYEVDHVEFLRGKTGKIKVLSNSPDPWGFVFDHYKEECGEYRLMTDEEAAEFCAVDAKKLRPVRIIEDGPIRTIVEALFCKDRSQARLTYTIPKMGSEIEISILMYNYEKDKKVKLEFDTGLGKGEYEGKTAFGIRRLKTDGNETVAQDYVLFTERGKTLSIINFGNYGSDCKDGVISVTLLTGCAYSAHPIPDREVVPQDRFTIRMDQGEREFRFILNASDTGSRKKQIDFESQLKHQPPFALNFFPTGEGRLPKAFIELSNSTVTLSAVKRSEDGNCLVVRLFNSSAACEETVFRYMNFGIEENLLFRPFEVKTFRVEDGRLISCNVLEEKK